MTHLLTSFRAIMLAGAVATASLAVPAAAATPAPAPAAVAPAARVSAWMTLAQTGQPLDATGTRQAGETKGVTRSRRQRAQPATVVPKTAPVPAACAAATGVERRICVECDAEPTFKRIGCQQRVFWSACKGKRLFSDSYCRTHQDQGPPRGEGS